eukprot:8558657-Alexandrium_andersonii.AAC.1
MPHVDEDFETCPRSTVGYGRCSPMAFIGPRLPSDQRSPTLSFALCVLRVVWCSEPSAGAVSYTHLTLPTICSV